jgi:hypothetical protein
VYNREKNKNRHLRPQKTQKEYECGYRLFSFHFCIGGGGGGGVETATGKEEGTVEGEEETLLPTLTKIFLPEGHKTSDTGVKIKLFGSFKNEFLW